MDEISRLRETVRQQEVRLRELEESATRLHAFLESASQGVVAIDPAGTILLVNAKTEELFGYAREELIGAKLEVLLPEGLRQPHTAHRADYFRVPRSRPMGVGMELKARKKDGAEFPVEISLSFVKEPQRQLALALITDISERKKLELQIQQAQKMESLGVMAGGVAHDFNNLLTGIIGNVSMVLDETSPDDPSYPLLREALDAGEHAATLTRQLLAYAGKGRFFIRKTDIPTLVRHVVALVRSSIPGNVEVVLDLPDRLPAISADSGQLEQLFTNLIVNGAEAIGAQKRGTVRITAAAIDSEAPLAGQLSGTRVRPGRYVSVDVQDTGCGMDEATAARIFEPFFTTKFTGRGLGLAAAHGIVESHKGAILVFSKPGEGSTFKVLLPAAQDSEPGTGRTGAAERAKQSGVVLVVDDEELIRNTARSALQRYGYTVLVAEDGPAALDLVRGQGDRICAIILDLAMPRMDGAETLRHLRALRPDIPVLLSSGFGEVEATQRLAGEHLAGFIEKPYTPAGLAEQVKKACSAPRHPHPVRK